MCKQMDSIPMQSWSAFVKRRMVKSGPLMVTLVGLVITAFDSCAYAELFVSNPGAIEGTGNILRFDERTGDFLGEFIPDRGWGRPDGLVFGPDGNLYVCSGGPDSILRYDGITGDPLPSPGNSGATFVPSGSGGLTFGGPGEGGAWLVFGPDGNLYVPSGSIGAPPAESKVLRFNGTTGEFIDAFVPAGSGGLQGPRGLVFGPDGNLYVEASRSAPGSVLRYDGRSGDFLDVFVPAGSNPFGESGPGNTRGLVFGPDGNLYVSYGASASGVPHPSVLRYGGTTGALIDAFVSEGSGGLSIPTGPLFGPDGNLYIRSVPYLPGGPGTVKRYDGTTGAYIDDFVPSEPSGLAFNKGFVFRNSDPVTLTYVAVSRIHITARSTAIASTAFDITVTALDANGNIDTSYQGTVTFSTTDPDTGVVLPADYTFTTGSGGDNGVHTFSGGVTLITVGNQTLTVTDPVSGRTISVTITVGSGP
jgi:sugar lactone lactonase YvrE